MSSKNRKVILMDTCSLIEFLDNDNKHYYMSTLKTLISDGYLFTITPYTLYEYLAKVDENSICDFTNKICFNSDFWVLNVNHIFEDYEGYVDGRSFAFRFNMHTNDKNSFYNSIKSLKEKVYKTLSPKIYFLAQVIAILWIIYTESDNDGKFNQDTHFKIRYIDEYFLKQHKKRYDLVLSLEYEKDDVKYRLSNDILSLSFEMIGLANVEMNIWKNSLKVKNDEYNRMIFEELDRLEPIFNSAPLNIVHQRFMKRTKKRIPIDTLLGNLLKGMKYNLTKDSFKKLICKAYSKEGLHKKETNNDIIDFTNMCLIEDFSNVSVAFLTSEKKWLKYIMNSKDSSLDKTHEIISNYIKPEYLKTILG